METLVMCNIALCIKITFMNYLNLEGNPAIFLDLSKWITLQKFNLKGAHKSVRISGNDNNETAEFFIHVRPQHNVIKK
jgi:hypothetical protein